MNFPVRQQPVIIPIDNPAQKEPPSNVSGVSPPPGPQDLVQPMPPPNPEPPPIAVQRADEALAKDTALSGKGKGIGAKTGKGTKTKAKDAQTKAGSKARSYGTIGEQPIEMHRIDTPPKETTGAAKKSQSRIGVNSIKILQRNYRVNKQGTRGKNTKCREPNGPDAEVQQGGTRQGRW